MTVALVVAGAVLRGSTHSTGTRDLILGNVKPAVISWVHVSRPPGPPVTSTAPTKRRGQSRPLFREASRWRRCRWLIAGIVVAVLVVGGITTDVGVHESGPSPALHRPHFHSRINVVTGSVEGVLEIDGGPATATVHGVSGSILFVGQNGMRVVVATLDDGQFSTSLPHGTYTATGQSPTVSIGWGWDCGNAGAVVVQSGATTNVTVQCQIS
jgi:hypothetical protein